MNRSGNVRCDAAFLTGMSTVAGLMKSLGAVGQILICKIANEDVHETSGATAMRYPNRPCARALALQRAPSPLYWP